MKFIFKKIKERKHRKLNEAIHTELNDAVFRITERRKDNRLVKEIESYLGHDVPSHFQQNKPVFYLSRYVATPDYETLFYIEQVKKYDCPIIIGEDSKDKLTSHSSLKRNLLKLPVVTGESKNGEGIIQCRRVSDMNAEQGKTMDEAELINGEPLINLHHYLAKQLLPKNIQIVDESEWVNRNFRGKLVQLYEQMLALFITHGIMMEIYEPYEIDFMENVVLPAMESTEKRFGYKPLLAPLVQKNNKKITDFNSYPKSVLKHIDDFFSKETF